MHKIYFDMKENAVRLSIQFDKGVHLLKNMTLYCKLNCISSVFPQIFLITYPFNFLEYMMTSVTSMTLTSKLQSNTTNIFQILLKHIY